jgi:hypothetical protein
MPKDFQSASLGTRVSKGKEKAEAARPRPFSSCWRSGPTDSAGVPGSPLRTGRRWP